MKCNFLSILLLISISACDSPLTGDLLIENVNIIDLESGTITQDRDILIKGNKITGIVQHGTGNMSSVAVINGRNRFLVPGLWDMHVHVMRNKWYESQMPLMRANGITGFREMWGDLAVVREVKAKTLGDSLPYFRFIAPGHILDGGKPFWNRSIPVATSAQANNVIDSLREAGADFIKVYSFLDTDVFSAIAKHCRELSIPFAGHVPHRVKLTMAANAGMASMEHLYGFLPEVCSDPDSAFVLMNRSVDLWESGNKKERKLAVRRYNSFVLENFTRQKLDAVCEVLKRNNTYIVPTLATLRGIYFINDTTFTNDPRKRYLSNETLEYWGR
jgi:hypothetical protein